MRITTAPHRALIGLLSLTLIGALTACAPSPTPTPGGDPGTSSGSGTGEQSGGDQQPAGSSECHFEFQIDGYTIDSSMPEGGKNKAQVVYDIDSSGALETLIFQGADDSAWVHMEFRDGPTGPGPMTPNFISLEFTDFGDELSYNQYLTQLPGTLTVFDHPHALAGDISGTFTSGVGPNTESVDFTATFSATNSDEGVGGFRCYAP